MDKKCRKKCLNSDKNGLEKYLTINLRHFLLIYNPFWRSGDFLDTFRPSRSVWNYQANSVFLGRFLLHWVASTLKDTRNFKQLFRLHCGYVKNNFMFSFSGLSQMGNLKVFMKTPTAVQTTLQQTSSSKIKVVPTVRLKSEKPDPIITTDR